jgi:hypothetical protein
VIIADNQIYVRGAADPNVTGIALQEPAMNVNVHDNLIRNCGIGLKASRGWGRVGTVVDGKTFELGGGFIAAERRQSHRYQGWPLVWLSGGKPAGTSTVESFDPETKRFTLKEPRETKAAEQFETCPPAGANWDLHHNTISDCLTPVVLDCYGSETSRFQDNTLSRTTTTGVKQALSLSGRMQIRGNVVTGFEEPGSVTLMLLPDRFGQPLPNVIRDNVFERCVTPVGESTPGLWRACATGGNVFRTSGQPPQ